VGKRATVVIVLVLLKVKHVGTTSVKAFYGIN
jgi:GrpB-like predicted nucleotidyltransferase (UPF0157 family)